MSPSGTVTVHEARAARATRAVLGLEARPQCHLKIRPLAPKTIAARRRCQAASQPSPRSLRRSTLQLIQLEAIKHRLRVGPPLPFNVRQADHTLLAGARPGRGQRDADGGAVRTRHAGGHGRAGNAARPDHEATAQAAAGALGAVDLPGRPGLASAAERRLRDGAGRRCRALVALVERDPDLAIFQVLRQHGSHPAQYGVNHAVHCTIAVFLAAHRLGLGGPDVAHLQGRADDERVDVRAAGRTGNAARTVDPDAARRDPRRPAAQRADRMWRRAAGSSRTRATRRR